MQIFHHKVGSNRSFLCSIWMLDAKKIFDFNEWLQELKPEKTRFKTRHFLPQNMDAFIPTLIVYCFFYVHYSHSGWIAIWTGGCDADGLVSYTSCRRHSHYRSGKRGHFYILKECTQLNSTLLPWPEVTVRWFKFLFWEKRS